MKTSWIRNAVLGTMVVAGLAGAKTIGTPVSQAEQSNAQLAAKVLHEIRMYPRVSIFDDVKFRVTDGTVALLGEVTQPYKKDDLGNILARVPGVTTVSNELRVAPLSPFDDRLRWQVANAIYRDPALFRLGMGTLPSIHILVDRGHVTLEGVVNTQAEKDIAGIRANAGMSFGMATNNLQVLNAPAAKRG